MVKLTHFDVADYLDNEEAIAEYITAAQDNPNPDAFLTAVRDVAAPAAWRMLAKDVGLGIKLSASPVHP